MSDWIQAWSDPFDDLSSLDRWVGGHFNESLEASIRLDKGLHFDFLEGKEYASVALVTRAPLVGDFDAQVRFSTSSPGPGTSLELAAIAIDGPRDAALKQSEITPDKAQYQRSRVYNVHGAPPYVSSEFDEADGARIGWNRGPAIETVRMRTAPGDGVSRFVMELITDNHYNRYGKSVWPNNPVPLPVAGWLRLQRQGDVWSAWYRSDDEGDWLPTGQVQAMNLPAGVFLRLAAKHWVKGTSGATARQTQAVFSDFALSLPATEQAAARAPIARSTTASNPPPAEVELVHQVRHCSTCAHFSTDSPYGAFIHVQEGDQPGEPDAARPVIVRSVQRPEPDVLYGCRKAPLMVVGINPNLTQGWLAPKAGSRDAPGQPTGSWTLRRWVESDAAYAAAHRFAPKPRLRAESAAELDQLLEVGSRMFTVGYPGDVAPAGEVSDCTMSWRDPRKRKVRLIPVDKDGNRKPAPPLGWKVDEQLLVLRHAFEPSQAIAGVADSRSAVGKTLMAREHGLDGYYRNAENLLKALERAWPQQPGQPQAQLRLGEDVSLHDAIACASPGWSSWEIPDSVHANCVVHPDRRFLHRQIDQSEPAVLLVAGGTALRLMDVASEGRLSRPIKELPTVAGGKNGMFAQLSREPLWWTPARTPDKKIRVLLLPHLSYPQNYDPQSQFDSEAAWLAFSNDHPGVVELLVTQNRLRPAPGEPAKPEAPRSVKLEPESPLWAAIKARDPVAHDVLLDSWINPLPLVGQALVQALSDAGIGLRQDGALERTVGRCAYCKNDSWTIGSGCSYEVPG